MNFRISSTFVAAAFVGASFLVPAASALAEIQGTPSYDSKGRLVQTTDSSGNVETYTYDRDGRLIAMTDSSGHTQAYVYDAAGNRSSSPR